MWLRDVGENMRSIEIRQVVYKYDDERIRDEQLSILESLPLPHSFPWTPLPTLLTRPSLIHKPPPIPVRMTENEPIPRLECAHACADAFLTVLIDPEAEERNGVP